MSAVSPYPARRGLALLEAHCASLDPEAPSARERLERALGADLVRTLMLILLRRGSSSRERFAA